MNSNIFNYIGIGSIDPAIYIFVLLFLILVLLVVVIVQGCKISKLIKKYDAFMHGKNAKSMENEIIALFDDIRFLKEAESKDAGEIRAIKNNLLFSYQKHGVVRYDAFREMGGKMSYSIALLNDNNDGFIINSIHSSEGCYSFAKEIRNGESQIVLGDEEREALNIALSVDTHSKISSREKQDSQNKKNTAKTDRKYEKKEKAPSKANDNIELDLEEVNFDELGFEEV